MKPFNFNTAPRIVFGEGSLARIGEITAAQLGKRVLLVTDPGLIKVGLIEPALMSLEAAGVAVSLFSDVEADPPEHVVMACTKVAQDLKAEGVIGLGGGSSMDVAKLAALLAPGTEKLADAYGVGNAKGPRLPLLLAPTTAGTGSEVTPVSIVTTGASEKKGVVSPVILPDVALLDPDLTLGLPPAVTAATGIDAMVHAIEAYASASPANNPVSRALAREALRLMGAALERAVHNGKDKAARGDMLLGAMLAGQAFANSPVAAVHALAYPLGGHYHIPHGLSNALMLPHVLRFNAETSSAAYVEIAPDAFPELEEVGSQVRAAAFADKLAGLSTRCGLQQRLRDVGIPADAVPMLARDAMKQTRLLVNNPRPVTEADALAIYQQAW
ncbi:MAG TPA: iron-containing alcohol dehydrogenase [Hypericibacter adhaerens]|jgi:alcohol dehydrogenase class IV|uniref:Alcohol dehydrogenase 2 n=1 Tax=Hypericibacter adhaerens TaxID=2602016 RepID=A0A5J6MWS8_9PROT|nr:iron-containing alcohol dehydrogenase [Hypericibacter adhaerens]QEX20660.1 alcohol dehydrogenase [Hypericibacter adhaerens]HWA45080.1 iron-containing alcohol dehydrogenase [Hypericibacter adhaerens]